MGTIRSKLESLGGLTREHGGLGMIRYVGHRIERLVRRDLLRQRYVIKRIHGRSMVLDLHDEGISRQLFHCRDRERDTQDLLARVLHEGMTVLDVGANIGYYVLLELDLVGPSGRLLAVEPIAENVELLSRNLAENGVAGRVVLRSVGVSDRKGTATVFLSERRNLHTFAPADERPPDDVSPGTDAPTAELRVTTLSELARSLGPFDFVRMDIEGYEVEAIRGMEEGLRGGWLRPAILFETHPPKYLRPGHALGAPLELLFEHGYRVGALSSTRHRESAATYARLGYRPERVLWTDGDQRAIYADVSREHARELLRTSTEVRSVLLLPPPDPVRRN